MSLTHVENRVVVKVDMNFKNKHTFSNGYEITLARGFDNFERRYTEPVNAIVISAEDIPEGSHLLIHHNSCHEVHRIYNYQQLSGVEIAEDIRTYSIPESEAFAWKNPTGAWAPMKGFDFALRVFKPYHGIIENIKPTKYRNTLYMTSGDYRGLVVRTIKAVDYEIIFREPSTGQESRLIRCRPYGNEKEHREEEVVAIDHKMTKQVLNNELLIGLSEDDCKPLNKYVCQ